MTLREEAEWIMKCAIRDAQPDEAVARALKNKTFGNGKVLLVAIGKAAWQMAKSAITQCGSRIDGGIVITKYGHVQGNLYPLVCFEAGHPVPDDNTYLATEKALNLVSGLSEEDTVLFLISGGGSALFEKPLVSSADMEDVTRQLLASGADIVEMNTIRKRLSMVKGGRFAQLVKPARVYTIILSDILGDPPDMIASGPAYPDPSTCSMAQQIIQKYHLSFSEKVMRCLQEETPKTLDNVETVVTGSVRGLCESAEKTLRDLGYDPFVLTASLNCEARQAGSFLAAIAREKIHTDRNLAFLAGGETVVHLTGHGKGGRNQEIALSAAQGIDGLDRVAVFSFGSDGTDGPTDAAGGFVTGRTAGRLRGEGMLIPAILEDNNAYPALKLQPGHVSVQHEEGMAVRDVGIGQPQGAGFAASDEVVAVVEAVALGRFLVGPDEVERKGHFSDLRSVRPGVSG